MNRSSWPGFVTVTRQICINKIHLCNAEETQKLHLKWHLDVFTHCLMQDMNVFNLQLQMQKCFDIRHKMLKTYLKL